MFAHEKVLLLKELRKRRIKVEISNVWMYMENTNDALRKKASFFICTELKS